MIRTAAASTYTELAQTPNGSSTQPCSEVQERYVVAVFLSSSAVRVLSLSSFLVSRTLSGSLFASPSSLCFLYVRLILNCERIAIKYAAALLYIIPSISYQVSYSSIIHSRSGVTDVGLLYHTRSLAVRVLSLSSFLVSRTLSGSLFASPSSLCFLYVRLILNCERIAIKYAAALLYIIPSISYQVSYSSIIHSRSGVTDVGLLYHTRSLAVRM